MSPQAEARTTEYKADSGALVKLSPSIIRNYLVNGKGNVSDQDVTMFLMLCKNQRLDPFLREAYLIKYTQNAKDPATLVVGKEVFTKRAERDPTFRGYQAGVIVCKADTNDDGSRTVPARGAELVEREGALVLPDEMIVGGWAKVYKDNRDVPYYQAAPWEEYVGKTSEGRINRQWESKPGTMIRKVALMQALREAFPEQLGALYDAVEMNTVNGEDLDDSPIEPKDVTPGGSDNAGPTKETQDADPTPPTSSGKPDGGQETSQTTSTAKSEASDEKSSTEPSAPEIVPNTDISDVKAKLEDIAPEPAVESPPVDDLVELIPGVFGRQTTINPGAAKSVGKKPEGKDAIKASVDRMVEIEDKQPELDDDDPNHPIV